ncbi:hypothetical protein SAY87_005320 [Trapa incisa]|uniref:Uncharacterized protein n=1 Tax=Trapa incisa TaxID=236973 RepID=A0AAN7Q6M3_9MYRT|nr:hypothetical protein SAY87_005320 [Trapa incisa]
MAAFNAYKEPIRSLCLVFQLGLVLSKVVREIHEIEPAGKWKEGENPINKIVLMGDASKFVPLELAVTAIA